VTVNSSGYALLGTGSRLTPPPRVGAFATIRRDHRT
jgi:hypothetical protein